MAAGTLSSTVNGALNRIDIDPKAPTPLYHQLYTVLRDRIRGGAFPSGSVLPAEQELCALFDVSRITVKRALNELASAGLVTRHRGRGTVVTYNPSAPIVKASFENLLANLRVMGLATEVELLEAADAEAPVEIAELLRLSPGAKVQRAVRVRRIEGQPFSYLVTHVPADIAALYAREELAREPLLRILERVGFAAVEADQWLTACAAEPAIARALDAAAGSPLMRIVRVMRDANGRPVEALTAYYRPERFQHHMKLTRRKRGGAEEWV